MVQGGEGGQEHRPLELAVAASWGVLAVDRDARGLCGRGKAGVGSQVGGGGEADAVTDGDQQCGGDPDADAGQRRRDLRKRVVLQQGCDLRYRRPSLFVDDAERARGGITMSIVPVPGTMTVCSSRASKMSRPAGSPFGAPWAGSPRRACGGRLSAVRPGIRSVPTDR